MREVTTQARKDDLSAIKTKLDAFKAAAAALGDPASWKPTQSSTSSDPSKLDVTLLGGAGIGGHSIQIDKLASSAQHGFTYTPSGTAGSIDLYYGSDPNAANINKVSIAVAANATAADIATAVNANEASPVYAAVVKDGAVERLVFSARKTGENSDFTATSADVSLAEVNTYKRIGTTLNASYKLDGEADARSSETNIVENAIPGVRLNLKGVTASPATVTTTPAVIDKAAIGAKVKGLVDAYNAVVTAVRTEVTEKRDPKLTTTSGLQKGALFGDSGLTSMLSQLKEQMRQTVTGLGLGSVADLGITVPKAGASVEEAKSGKMVFDSAVLTTALDADWTKVRDLFTGKGEIKGVSALMSDYVGTQTGTKGILTGRVTTEDSVLKSFTSQIEKFNERMVKTEARLHAQFAAMEKALGMAQSQQSWLSGQIASLPSY
jgi:flagellar hook-associated protein 2